MKFDPKMLNPMALKDVDWKQFFIEKGERVGLGVAAFLMVVITGVSLFMPNHGFLVPLPSVNANILNESADRVTSSQNSAIPSDDDRPPIPDKNIKFESSPIADPESYQVVKGYIPPPAGTTKRRVPDLLNVDEGTADVAFAQIRSFVFSKMDDNPYGYIQVLDGATGANVGANQVTQRNNNAPAQNVLRGLAQGALRPGGGAIGAGQAAASPIRGGGQFGSNPGGGFGGGRALSASRPGQTGAGPVSAPGRTAMVGRFVKVSDITENTSYHYAERVLPMRVAIVCATFPYRKQIEEFQRKLRLATPAEVLNEASSEEDDGQLLPAFRFLGVDVQRRVLNPDGKPVEPWQTLDLSGSLREYIIQNGKRFEPDPPELKPLIVNGLWMPLLLQFEENKFNRYPEIEKRLSNVRKTLDDLKAKPQEAVLTAWNPITSTDNFDAFNISKLERSPKSEAHNPTAPPDSVASGGGFGRNRRSDRGLIDRSAGNFRARSSESTATENGVVPEHVLVRILDVNIEPGKIYEYRLHVRMANPNYKRYGEVMSASYAEDKELHAEKDRKDSDWFVVPKKVSVPPEFRYYAVDQKEIDGPTYSGIHARDNVNPDYQTVFQIHRWLEDASRDTKEEQWVGEWAVAERVIVAKGESIGRTENVFVPIWRPALEAFVMAVPTQAEKNNRKKAFGIDVDFSLPNDDAVLVDFEGGLVHFKRNIRREDRVEPVKTDERITQEVLLVTSDGRVIARNNAIDARNAERVAKLQSWRGRVAEVLLSGQGVPSGPFAPGQGLPGGSKPGGVPGGPPRAGGRFGG